MKEKRRGGDVESGGMVKANGGEDGGEKEWSWNGFLLKWLLV